MKKLPILFSGPMVQALREGRKTMTRRIAVAPCKLCGTTDGTCKGPHSPSQSAKIVPGDLLYVRETFSGPFDIQEKPSGWPADTDVWYWADGNPMTGDWTKPKPGIHLPRVFSRITLRVTATKIERLNDISEEDARAEGAPWYVYGHGVIFDEEYRADPGYQPNKRMGFCQLWNDLHGWGPPSAWDANPEVVAISFDVYRKNVDAMEETA